MDLATFTELVESRRLELNLTMADVAERVFGDRSRTPIQDLKRGSVPSLVRAAAISRALSLDFRIGPSLETPKVNVRHQVSTVKLDSEDFVSVPLYDAQASAGHGILNDTEEVERHILFRRDWMRDLGVALPNAALLRARGDSMHPVIQSGDLMMIDTSQVEIPISTSAQKRRIWVIRDGDDLRVKWIHRPDKSTLIIMSQNHEAYPPEVIRARDGQHHSLVGRVVWWGHSER